MVEGDCDNDEDFGEKKKSWWDYKKTANFVEFCGNPN